MDDVPLFPTDPQKNRGLRIQSPGLIVESRRLRTKMVTIIVTMLIIA